LESICSSNFTMFLSPCAEYEWDSPLEGIHNKMSALRLNGFNKSFVTGD
jgi:hypothetical protein